MIAGRSRNHSAQARFLRQKQNFVQGAALLERSRHLQILQLEIDRISGEREKVSEWAHGTYKSNRGFDVGRFQYLRSESNCLSAIDVMRH